MKIGIVRLWNGSEIPTGRDGIYVIAGSYAAHHIHFDDDSNSGFA